MQTEQIPHELQTYIRQAIDDALHQDVQTICRVGEGFYGTVYRADVARSPFHIIVKCFKHPRRCVSERDQLDLLRQHSLLKIPEVYAVYTDRDNQPDILLMEYIQGVNAAQLPTDHPHREAFVDEMIGNLIHLHSVHVDKGFDIGQGTYSDWTTCYRQRVESLFTRVQSDFLEIVSPYVMNQLERTVDRLDMIFHQPVQQPSLIHSDYNLWNVLVDLESAKITAVIDPNSAGWADRELDLFHLQNADGDRFGLLDAYRRQVPLSDNFAAKNAFYWLWDDVMHMVNVGWYDEARFRAFTERVQQLDQ